MDKDKRDSNRWVFCTRISVSSSIAILLSTNQTQVVDAVQGLADPQRLSTWLVCRTGLALPDITK